MAFRSAALGFENLVAHWPEQPREGMPCHESLKKPDLGMYLMIQKHRLINFYVITGPKMYIASPDWTGQGSTRLHLDGGPAVNIMLHCHPRKVAARFRREGLKDLISREITMMHAWHSLCRLETLPADIPSSIGKRKREKSPSKTQKSRAAKLKGKNRDPLTFRHRCPHHLCASLPHFVPATIQGIVDHV